MYSLIFCILCFHIFISRCGRIRTLDFLRSWPWLFIWGCPIVPYFVREFPLLLRHSRAQGGVWVFRFIKVCHWLGLIYGWFGPIFSSTSTFQAASQGLPHPKSSLQNLPYPVSSPILPSRPIWAVIYTGSPSWIHKIIYCASLWSRYTAPVSYFLAAWTCIQSNCLSHMHFFWLWSLRTQNFYPFSWSP